MYIGAKPLISRLDTITKAALTVLMINPVKNVRCIEMCAYSRHTQSSVAVMLSSKEEDVTWRRRRRY